MNQNDRGQQDGRRRPNIQLRAAVQALVIVNQCRQLESDANEVTEEPA